MLDIADNDLKPLVHVAANSRIRHGALNKVDWLDIEPDLAQEALWNEIKAPAFVWALSSIGQSNGLIIRRLQVRFLQGPPVS